MLLAVLTLMSLTEIKMLEKEEKKDIITKDLVWELMNQQKVSNPKMLDDHTRDFFKEEIRLCALLKSSNDPILQFGISVGSYLISNKFSEKRSIIGYDHSPTAIEHLQKNNINARAIDLNALDENNELNYKSVLKNDLSVSSQLLFIRVLEYLNPEAVKLLMLAILDEAKKGTSLFVEIFNPNKIVYEGSSVNFFTPIPLGYVPSFFAPRTDMEIISWKNHHQNHDASIHGVSSDTERFVVTKYR
jgi:hypothetical protein